MIQSAPVSLYGAFHMSLSGKQIRSLRSESHRLKLKPVVLIGQHGLSESVMNELEQAIKHHELMKIRLPGLEKSDKKAMLENLTAQLNATLVQSIGHTAVLFRENPDVRRYRKILAQ
jgi:RNA-binding protein